MGCDKGLMVGYYEMLWSMERVFRFALLQHWSLLKVCLRDVAEEYAPGSYHACCPCNTL